MHAVKNKADNKMSPLDGEFDAVSCVLSYRCGFLTLCVLTVGLLRQML